MRPATVNAALTVDRPRLRREAGYGLAVYFAWQYAVWLSRRTAPDSALRHGRWLWKIEGWLHVRVEPWLQHATLALPGLVDVANVYYDVAHVAGMAACLVWAWRRGPDVYRPFRNTVLIVTGLAFVVQAWQAAPLRVLGVGMVDTAAMRGVSIYELAHDKVDQFSAFPSLHVAWALLVAWVIARHGRGWVRLAAAHGPLTVLVVMATGNHSLLDCLSAALLVAVAVAVLDVLAARRRRTGEAAGR